MDLGGEFVGPQVMPVARPALARRMPRGPMRYIFWNVWSDPVLIKRSNGISRLIGMPGRSSAEDGLRLQEFVRELTASQGRIRAFLVSLMPGSPDVCDVLQETNIVLWKSRARFKPGTNFLAWAFTIARLEVLHHRTRAKRRRVVLLSDQLLERMAEEAPEELDHEAYLLALEGCKAKLPDSQRELIDLRYRPGYTLEAHARESGKKASTLRVSLLRIREALRECIEKTMKEHPA